MHTYHFLALLAGLHMSAGQLAAAGLGHAFGSIPDALHAGHKHSTKPLLSNSKVTVPDSSNGKKRNHSDLPHRGNSRSAIDRAVVHKRGSAFREKCKNPTDSNNSNKNIGGSGSDSSNNPSNIVNGNPSATSQTSVPSITTINVGSNQRTSDTTTTVTIDLTTIVTVRLPDITTTVLAGSSTAVGNPASVSTQSVAIVAPSAPGVFPGNGNLMPDGSCNCACACPAEMFSLPAIGSMPPSPATTSQATTATSSAAIVSPESVGTNFAQAFGGFGGSLSAAGATQSIFTTTIAAPGLATATGAPSSTSVSAPSFSFSAAAVSTSSSTTSSQGVISTATNLVPGVGSIAIVPAATDTVASTTSALTTSSSSSTASTTTATTTTTPPAAPSQVAPPTSGSVLVTSNVPLGVGSIAASPAGSSTNIASSSTTISPPTFSLGGGSTATATPDPSAPPLPSGLGELDSDVTVHLTLT